MQGNTMLIKCREISCFVFRQVQGAEYGTSVCETVSTIPKGSTRALTDDLAMTLAGIPCCSIWFCGISCTWQTAAHILPIDRICTTRIA
jgi:hypothetical protein